ncbi:MAG: amidohydrolase family protein [Pyrinomonadaceae bacterium]|nr:amidohydrolase family protein [Pyrinomonadaceae bacterium]
MIEKTTTKLSIYLPGILVILFFAVNCTSGQSTAEIDTKPLYLGETLTVKSNAPGEQRRLNIYLPEEYSKNSDQKFPVIYLLDGTADQNFVHVAGLVQFASFSWVKYLPASVLVGIGNTDRSRDFTFPTHVEEEKKRFASNGGSANFIDYIEKELQPFIDSKYRTNGTKTIIGHSLGGLLAAEILLKRPELFDRFILISPSLWWDKQSLLKAEPMAVNKKTEVYVAVGNEDKVMVGSARSLNAMLQKRKNEGLRSHFKYFPDESHMSIVHAAVYDAFQTFHKYRETSAKQIYDHHVHLMSPRLIKYFKDVGIPFSKPDKDYSDFDSIIKRLGTSRVNLVSMAYLFGHPEFGKVENEYDAVRAENDYVLKAKEKFPGKIKAYCGVNPLKSYALDEVKRCHRILKADGLKIHSNANQLYLTEPAHLSKIKPIYEYAAENDLPILLHFDNSHQKFGEPDIKLLFDEVLADIKPLRIQIAHFGTSGGFNPKTKRVIDAFITQFETNPKIKKHRILFDISAVALDKDSEGVSKLSDAEFAELAVYARKLGMDKIVFGTDYPLYSASEYLEILKMRVKFTDAEINTLLNNSK